VAVRYCVTRTVICSEEVSVWQEGVGFMGWTRAWVGVGPSLHL